MSPKCVFTQAWFFAKPFRVVTGAPGGPFFPNRAVFLIVMSFESHHTICDFRFFSGSGKLDQPNHLLSLKRSFYVIEMGAQRIFSTTWRNPLPKKNTLKTQHYICQDITDIDRVFFSVFSSRAQSPPTKNSKNNRL
jgi:hypothetical protein